jgi:multiple sugar transport system substrate-binding protein
LAVTTLLSACSSPSGTGTTGTTGATGAAGGDGSCTNKITKASAPQVTVWAWYPAFEEVVDLFNSTHDDVQICWSNVGAGGNEYNRFTTAIQAKSGAPDVIQLENEVLGGYLIQDALVDLTKYGANDVKANYTEGAWKDSSSGDGVYAIPVDGGPVGFMYRQDIFDKYKVAVPKTWEDFAQAAQQLKDAGFQGYMTDYAPNAIAEWQGLYNQAGASTFSFDIANPEKLGVDINSAPAKKVQAYWNDLISKKLVATDDAFTTDWYTKIVDGTYATVVAAAWQPGYLSGIAGADPAAKWVSAPILQWNGAKPAQVNWGGSTFAVTTQAKQPDLAAKVALDVFGNLDAWKIGVEKAALFPTYLPELTSDSFKNLASPFFNGQQINKDVYLPAAQGYSGTVYSPFTTYYYDQMTQANAKMIQGDITSDQVLDQVQDAIVSYATQQGFTVNK